MEQRLLQVAIFESRILSRRQSLEEQEKIHAADLAEFSSRLDNLQHVYDVCTPNILMQLSKSSTRDNCTADIVSGRMAAEDCSGYAATDEVKPSFAP